MGKVGEVFLKDNGEGVGLGLAQYLYAMRPLALLFSYILSFTGLTIYLGYFVQRIHFQSYIAAYTAIFGLYIWIAFFQPKLVESLKTQHWTWLGIGLRALLLFSIPNLSDDYARFLWDGHLTVAGIHPFLHLPSYFIENQFFPPGITPELFHKLNSPNYYTVYPPVCQAVFALAAWCFPSSELGGVFVMKLFLLACEIGTIRMLPLLVSKIAPGRTTFLYALNPLAILEICGNCHFEGAMLFFLLGGLLALQKGSPAKGAVWWAFATASKMIPLMFLPIVWRWLGWRKGLIFSSIFGVVSLLLFSPILVVLPNILKSLDLYFRKFQFNASVYYLVRELGYAKIGWDIGEFSGPLLGAFTILGILLIAVLTRPLSKNGQIAHLSQSMFFALFLYLSLAATIQPWYLTVPLALSVGTRWRFMIAWSGLIALSYSHYLNNAYLENYPLICLEYGLLWTCLILDLRRRIVP